MYNEPYKYSLLRILMKYLVSQSAAALGVEGMPGAFGDKTTLDVAPEQRHIADQVEQFVACRLVLVVERREVAEFVGVQVRRT